MGELKTQNNKHCYSVRKQNEVYGSHTSLSAIRCWRMWRVNIACDRDDCVFMFVLAVVRHKAPTFRHCIVYTSNKPTFVNYILF